MQYSPAFVELVAACHEMQTAQFGWAAWERLEAAAFVYAKANGIENFSVEQLVQPEQRRSTCPCCGHSRYITRAPGLYFNKKSLADLMVDEANKALADLMVDEANKAAALPPSQKVPAPTAPAMDAAERGNGA